MSGLARLGETLSRRPPRGLRLPHYRPAAVLVPLVPWPGGDLALLLTERAAELTAHAGQIAFPGGKLDAADASMEACALREAHEELGLDPAACRPLGRLDDVPTLRSEFVITPVVAELAAAPELVPNRAEVASYFFAPVAALRDPANFERHGVAQRDGLELPLIAYRFERYLIWGATARIIQQLLELV
jgi:8-oxo-dGTP pyrophosphatase MutT (NUDIX family)